MLEDIGPVYSRGAELLRQRMKRQNLSQNGLDKALGLGKGMANRWVRGYRRPGRKHASALQRLLGIPLPAWDQPAS